MVVMFIERYFIAWPTIMERVAHNNSHRFEQLECAVQGSERNTRAPSPHAAVQLKNVGVISGLSKNLSNKPPLAGQYEAVVFALRLEAPFYIRSPSPQISQNYTFTSIAVVYITATPTTSPPNVLGESQLSLRAPARRIR
jgi:hypothetical protein